MTTVYHATLSLPKDLVFISAVTSSFLLDEAGFVRTVKFYEIAWKTVFEKADVPMLIIPFDNNLFIITKKKSTGAVRKEFGIKYPDIKLESYDEDGIPRGLLEQTLKVVMLRVLADKGWMKIKDDSFIYAPLAPAERSKTPVRPLITLRFTLHGENEAYFTIETSAAKFTSLTRDTLLPLDDEPVGTAAEKGSDFKHRFEAGERIVNKDLDVTTCLVLPTLNMATISFIQKEPPTVGDITADVFKNYWRFMYGYKLTDELLSQGWASVALFTFMSYPVCCLTAASGLIELKGRARSVKTKMIKHFLHDLSSVSLPVHEPGQSLFSFKKMAKQPMTFDTGFVSVSKLISGQSEHPNLTAQSDTDGEKKNKTKKSFEPQDIEVILTALNPNGESLTDDAPLRKKKPVVPATPVVNKSPPPSVPKPIGRTLGLKVRPVEPEFDPQSKPLPPGRTLGAKRKKASEGPLYDKEPLSKKRKVQSTEPNAPVSTAATLSEQEERSESSMDESRGDNSTDEPSTTEFKRPSEPSKKREVAVDISSIDVAGLVTADTAESLSIPQLKAVLKSVKLPVGGKKQDLIERIKNNRNLFSRGTVDL